jgi:hypothetical protein
MRVLSVIMRPIKLVMARQTSAGIYMDTADQTFDARPTRKHYPVELTRLADFARKT